MAAGAIGIGGASGEGPPGDAAILVLALAATLVGCTGGAAIPALAAGFVVARYYTFDPYYAPALRRMSDGGLFSAGWIYTVAAAALAASALSAARRREGRTVAIVVLVVCMFTAFFESAGH